jgi:hypothetical protein
MCTKLRHNQYTIDCDRHGERIQSKYYDAKINRVGICKLCDWEQKYLTEINSKQNNFVKFLEPIFKNTQKVKALCSIHGEYENFVSRIVRAKKSAGCEKCLITIKFNAQYERSFKNKIEKKCTNCNQIKAISEFYKYTRKNGRECIMAKCIECENQRNREFSEKYRQTQSYINSQNRYKKTDKYKLSQRNLSIRRIKIKYVDIFYYQCINCNSNFISKNENKKYHLCKKCNTEQNQINYYDKYSVKPKTVNCIDCNKEFIGKFINTRCDNCRDKKQKEYKKEYHRKYEKKYGRTHIDRAKFFGCYYEKVDKLKVFERDKYKCKECGIECNINQHYNARDYPTLGHIVPLSLKGSHTYANVQCECRDCNENKNNKILGQQLTLYYRG